MNDNLTLEDLVNLSGLSLRTLRYYMQEGLLQGPDTHGKFARYSQPHLDRLEIIQRLKNLRLPLQEINQILINMTPEEISQIRQYQDVLKETRDFSVKEMDETPSKLKTNSDALDYIHNLERGRDNIRAFTSQSPVYSPAPQPPVSYQEKSTAQSNFPKDPTRESWTRTVLRDGIELNIRQPKTTEEQIMIEQLIEFAKRLFRDQTKREK